MISQHIGRLLGLHFSGKQLESMGRSVMKAAMDLKRDPQTDSLRKWLERSSLPKTEIEALARHLSVGETYFFREESGLELFRNEIIPVFRQQDREEEIRIWSAGCSSGEEPYTLAMLLNEDIPDLKYRNIRIMASDLNAEALAKAQKGIYSAWSFRETPVAYKNKYFSARGKHFEIRKDIREMVHFFQLNLAGSAYPSADNGTERLDVIFCRNVLMYFLPEMALAVAKRFYEALKPEAWLITSQVELHQEYYAAFKKIRYKRGIFYRKSKKDEKIYLLSGDDPPQIITGKGAEPMVPFPGRKKIDGQSPRRSTPRPKATSDTLAAGGRSHQRGSKVAGATVKPARAADQSTRKSFSLEKTEALFREARYTACAERCLDHLESGPFDPMVGELLVRSLANLGKHGQARQLAEKLLLADAENPTYLNLFATILMEQNDLLLAEKSLIKALYLDPHYVPALFNMYYVLNALGKDKLAKKYHKNLLKVIRHLKDHEEVCGLEGMTAGLVRMGTKKQ